MLGCENGDIMWKHQQSGQRSQRQSLGVYGPSCQAQGLGPYSVSKGGWDTFQA